MILTTPSDAAIKHLVQFKPNGINERRARRASLTLIAGGPDPHLVGSDPFELTGQPAGFNYPGLTHKSKAASR